MTKITAAILGVFLVILVSNPVAGSFFLCEKTDPDTGETIPSDDPRYDELEYDTDIVYILQTISNLILLGVFLFGISGAIYATIRDATFTGENSDDPAKYLRMRIRMIVAGVFIPIILIVLSFVIEFFTANELTCFVSIPIID